MIYLQILYSVAIAMYVTVPSRNPNIRHIHFDAEIV